MSYKEFAKRELDLIGMTEDSEEMDLSMRNHILRMVDEFSKEGHSGSSAAYAINVLEKILKFEPLTPLTGEDSEWCDVRDGVYQNNRCSRVFKDSVSGEVYDIYGKIFWEWYEYMPEPNEDGYPEKRRFKSYFTNGDSRVPVTFPYTPVSVYEERVSS